MIHLIGHGCAKQQACFMFTTQRRTMEKNDMSYDLTHYFYTHSPGTFITFSKGFSLKESVPVVRSLLMCNGVMRHTVLDRNYPFGMEINIFEEDGNYTGEFTIGILDLSTYTIDEGILEPSLIIPFMDMIKSTIQWDKRNVS